MNYFELFGIQPSFKVDSKLLKRQYLKLSKKYHPDFHTDAAPEVQQEALLKSSEINTAYTTLLEARLRLPYTLRLLGIISEDIKDELDQAFLMDMMDVNEQIMEANMSEDPLQLESLKQEIQNIENSLRSEVEDVFEITDLSKLTTDQNTRLKNYYFKLKYIRRLYDQMGSVEPEV